MQFLLKSPYPIYTLNLRRIIGILCIGAFVSFFLYLFQPFGTAAADFPNKTAFLLGYGPVVAVVLIIFEFIMSAIYFKKIKEEHWTIGKQILWILLYTSIALLACYLYKQWFFDYSIQLKDFGYFYAIGFSIALFPLVIGILLDYIYQLRKNQIAAVKMNTDFGQAAQEEKPSAEQKIRLIAENGKDQLELPLESLYYIRAADNYAEIIHFPKGEEKKEILRTTLQRLEKQLLDQLEDSPIYRCHRSFLVNLEKVKSVSGNAQGYKLHFENMELGIPVSRSKSKAVQNLLTHSAQKPSV